MTVTIRKNSTVTASSGNKLDFILSTEDPDHYDDVIVQRGWVLDAFGKNPACLFGHDPNFLIGKWVNVSVINNQLRGTLKLAPLGTSPRIDEVIRLIDAGLLLGCSVGFIPIQSEPRKELKRGGKRYLKQQLVEVSLVSTPANSQALLLEARKLGASASTIRVLFKQSVNASLDERQERARASLANARAVLAKADAALSGRKPPTGSKAVALIGMSDKTKKLYADAKAARARAEAILKKGGFKSTAERTAEKQKLLRELAAPTYASWQDHHPEPQLTFNGKPSFGKKGPFGW